MAQRKSGSRCGQACPAFLSMAKSAEAEKAGADAAQPDAARAVRSQAEATRVAAAHGQGSS